MRTGRIGVAIWTFPTSHRAETRASDIGFVSSVT